MSKKEDQSTVEAIKRRKINEAAEEKKLFKIYLMG